MATATAATSSASRTLAYCKWKDAVQDYEGMIPIANDPLVVLEEVGWLVQETEESVSLAMELEPDGTPGRWRLHIPRVNIIELRSMEFEKFPKRRRKI